MTAGAKTLLLRGVSSAANFLTSQLSDNGGALSIQVDGSTAWVLTNGANNYTGTTTVSAGALGIGDNASLGSGNFDLSSGTIFAYGADRTIGNVVRGLNNTGTGVIGDYSLTFTNPLAILAAANNYSLTNNVVAGKSVTFGGVTANTLPSNANRVWTVDGSGLTIINGDITTTQTAAGGLNLTKTGNGVLVLGGTGGGANNFNRNNATVDIDRGTLRLGASEVIGHGVDTQTTPVAYGSLTLSPELAGNDTAIFDLNGFNETINGLTANTDGTAIIDNTSTTAATLTFGAADAAVSFGGGTGTYTIQNSGGGALSLTKTGAGTALIPTGVTVSHSGATSANGGVFTIASPVTATTGLSVTGDATLALTGGITNPNLITSLEVAAGSTLSLLDGAGSLISNLTSLSLGNTGTGNATLNLNVGDGATDTLTLLTGNSASLGNSITFNMTDAGLDEMTTYTLLNLVDGGLNAYGFGNVIQGATPGGFTSMTWSVTDNLVQLTTGTLIIGDVYWRGLTDTTWNANANNWSTDKAGTTPAASIPGAGNKVIFAYDGVGTGALVTTLEQNFKVNSLVFESGTTTPASVTINPGTISTNRIEIAPSSSSDGIAISTGGPSNVTISGPVRLGGPAASQTWNVADVASVLSIGALLGEKDVTKTGAGKVILTTAADPTFNSGVTTDFTIDAGTLEIRDVSALGNLINSNLATVTVNSTGAFFYNGVASTATNLAMPITLGGGALSAGTANQIYSGTVNVSGNSFINMAENNGPGTATARSITLSGILSGSGSLTVSSNTSTLTAGNAEGGTLTLSNSSNTWNGNVIMQSGTIVTTATNGWGGGNVTFDALGRIIVRNTDGNTLNLPGTMTFSPNAIGEFSVDNTGVLASDFVVNQNGQVNIGSGGTGAIVRLNLADAASSLNIAGNVVLGGNSSISVEGGDANSFATISGVISDGGNSYGLAIHDDAGAWAATNTRFRLTGANTFGGNITLASGILEFTTASTVAGSVANSLGQGTAISVTGSSTLSFVGTSAQSTDRPITVSAGVLTLSANGATAADTITYAGTITIPATTADGTQLTLTGTAGSVGIISGGVSQTISGTNITSDVTVSGGTWTHTGTSVVPDDMTVTGASTILNLNGGVWGQRDDLTVTTGAMLNINSTGALSFNTSSLSADASLRAVTGGIITIGANDAVDVTQFDGLRIGTDATGTGTLVMNANQTVTEFILGNRNIDRDGVVNGTGILNVTGNFDLYSGTISARLASTGTTVLEKIGAGTVTLSGDNSGLASTGATIVYDGILALNYTADNNTKLRAASALDLRGARLNVIGNNGAATSQAVGGLTLASGGSSTIQVTGGTGQEAVLILGAITRGNNAQDGTIRFMTPAGAQSATNGITTTSPNSTFGMLGTGVSASFDAAYATIEDGTGTWFATASGGNVVALTSTAKDDISTWLPGDHVTDNTGFTGTLQHANINSLRYNAASGSDVIGIQGGVLLIGSGGFLITSSVGGTPSLMGGTIVSGATELVITQDSSQLFEISSDIRTNAAVTKTGTGTLRLTGNNTYTGITEIQEGILQVGGNAIGDTSIVNLSASRATTLELLDSETIGRLSGGQRATDGEYGTVAVGSHTLTINNSGGNTTYAGFFTGDGNVIRQGTHNLSLTNVSSGFTGVFTIESGAILLSNLGQINANVIRINKGGALMLDNNSTTRSGTRILDTTTLTLNSADGTFQGSTIVRGLAIRTDQAGTLDETVGTINLNSGTSYVGMEATTVDDDSDIIAGNIVRLNRSTLNVRGNNLGNTNNGATAHNNFRIGDATNEASFVTALVGGGGAAGTQTVSIVPWAIGQDTNNFLNTNVGVSLADTHMGNSLMTYVAGVGFRPLNFATEYDTFSLASATDNVRESRTTDLSGLTTATMNALVIHNDNMAASTINVTGTGTGGQTLTNTSGAFLFTLNTAATASSAHSTILGGFDGGIATPSGEYIFHVVNPSSAANTATQTVTVQSVLTSTADITKSGRGRLIFTAANTAGGGSSKTTINEGELEISDLDNIGGNTGGLVFSGGILRLSDTYSGDDISTRTITLLDGGGTINTNGMSLALANSVGSGLGGLTKIGLGTLTLNAAATYTGSTTISGGVLAVGANNGTGIGGAVNITAGAELALGSNSITAGLVSTSGASPIISGTGTINASSGFFFSHTGDTQINAILAGPGGLFKNQSNVVTLTGLNVYTGTTEVQAGTLSFDSIGNVGAGASALGAPATVEDGIIRMGLTTAATTLTYTGTGHSTDRIIELQGTTGGVTINADGTGVLALGRIQSAVQGNKTLTLSGSSTGFDNTVAEIKEVGSAVTLAKSGPSTWLIAGASDYTGATQINNGILKIGVNDALPTATAVRIGTGSTAGTLDLNGFNQTIGSLTVQTNSDVVTNQILVDSGNTLTINGAVSIGAAVEDGNTNLNAFGGGAIVVNSGNANFIVGTAATTANSRVDVDFTGLSSFTANLGNGFFRLGDPNTDTEANPSTFKLAVDNTITASAIRIGDGSGAAEDTSLHTLTLGSGTNLFNADTFNIGSAGATIRSGGAVVFDAGDTTGTLTVRASNGTDRATINLINTTGSTAGNMSATLDLAGHTADILASTLTMAARTQNSGAGTATLTFDQGTLDVITLNMASRTGAGTGNATATLNLGDSAAPGAPTTTIGTLNMAVNTSAGGTVTADFNVTGGSVTIGTGSGTAINMANAGASRSVTSSINLTGGAVAFTGNIIRTGGAGTETATLTLNGASLGMGGFSLGTGAAPISFVAQSGALAGLGELNGGGILEKTGAGVLSLGNGNTYTGGTAVSTGTLLATNTLGSATGSGWVTVELGATLGGNGIIAPAANTNIIVDGTLQVGAAGDVSAQQLTLTSTGTGLVTVNGIVAFDLFSGQGSGTLNDGTNNDVLVVGGGSGFTLGAGAELHVSTSLPIDGSWVAGAEWRLFDWSGLTGGVSGTFDNLGDPAPFNYVNLPDLSSIGLAWDVSNLYTAGTIMVVVPEPGRMLLVFLGLMGLFFRRRR